MCRRDGRWRVEGVGEGGGCVGLRVGQCILGGGSRDGGWKGGDEGA